MELNGALAKDVEKSIRNKQADSAIGQVTRRTLESESFVEKITQSIFEGDNVLNSLATHAKRHVDKEMDDWRV